MFTNAWLDNHNFMLEKLIYSEEFMSFVKDLIGLVYKPVDYIPSKTTNSSIYEHHSKINEIDSRNYEDSLRLCSKLFFNIFYKA
jgi:hypothetical protein